MVGMMILDSVAAPITIGRTMRAVQSVVRPNKLTVGCYQYDDDGKQRIDRNPSICRDGRGDGRGLATKNSPTLTFVMALILQWMIL